MSEQDWFVHVITDKADGSGVEIMAVSRESEIFYFDYKGANRLQVIECLRALPYEIKETPKCQLEDCLTVLMVL